MRCKFIYQKDGTTVTITTKREVPDSEVALLCSGFADCVLDMLNGDSNWVVVPDHYEVTIDKGGLG